MPHLIVEYSSNLAGFPEAQTLTKLNQAVTSSPEVLNEADLKTRIVATDSYVIGTAPGPGPRAFVYSQLRLLSGRSLDAKRDLSDRSAGVLCRLTPRPNGVLVDMDRGSYTRDRPGGA